MPNSPDLPILVGDPDRGFLKSLAVSSARKPSAPVLVSSRLELDQAIDLNPDGFAGVFVSPRLTDNWGIPVIQEVRTVFPATPIFYILDPNEAKASILDSEQLKRLTVSPSIQKPCGYQDLIQAMNNAVLSFNPKVAIEKAALNTDSLGIESSGKDFDFTPISARNFISGATCYFDVYVRLGTDKYVKILKGGDPFSPERLTKYREKGVQQFFLRKETQEQYVRYCYSVVSCLSNTNRVSPEAKAAQVFNLGQETSKYLRQIGVDSATVHYAESYVKSVRTVIQDIRLDRNAVIRGFMNSIVSVDHGSAATLIASLLSGPLGFKAEKCIEVIGLGAFFHDLALTPGEDGRLNEDPLTMSEDQLFNFHLHPKSGAEVLINLPEVSPTVVQAVLQHHERRNRTGFPSRLGAGQINRVAEIVGISEEFVQLIHQASLNSKIDPLRLMEKRIFPGFSAEVVASFRSVFFRN